VRAVIVFAGEGVDKSLVDGRNTVLVLLEGICTGLDEEPQHSDVCPRYDCVKEWRVAIERNIVDGRRPCRNESLGSFDIVRVDPPKDAERTTVGGNHSMNVDE